MGDYDKDLEKALNKICEAWNIDKPFCFWCGLTEEQLRQHKNKERRILEIDHITDENIGENSIEKAHGHDLLSEVIRTPIDEIRERYEILCDDDNNLKNSIIRKMAMLMKRNNYAEFENLYFSTMQMIKTREGKEAFRIAVESLAKSLGYYIEF